MKTKAELAAGNWSGRDNFYWYDPPEDPERWYLHSLRHRDSGLLDQSNADAIIGEMSFFLEEGTARVYRFDHWGFGWIEELAVRVFWPDGTVTAAFEQFEELMESLADYPVLDESDYCKREHDATCTNIEEAGRKLVKDKAPEDWPHRVYSWLYDNDDKEVQNRDDRGAYPSEGAIAAALEALGLSEWSPDQVIPTNED